MKGQTILAAKSQIHGSKRGKEQRKGEQEIPLFSFSCPIIIVWIFFFFGCGERTDWERHSAFYHICSLHSIGRWLSKRGGGRREERKGALFSPLFWSHFSHHISRLRSGISLSSHSTSFSHHTCLLRNWLEFFFSFSFCSRDTNCLHHLGFGREGERETGYGT